MGRVKVYGTLDNEHRRVAVGGRRPVRTVTAWLNTDNAEQRNCGAYLTANVRDDNCSRFLVELPLQPGDFCSTDIRLLAGAGFATDMFPRQVTYEEVFNSFDQVGNIRIPGGFTLQFALTCISLVAAHGLCPGASSLERFADAGSIRVSSKRRSVIS